MNTHTLSGWYLDYFTGLALGYEMSILNDGAGPAYRACRTDTAFEPTVRAMDTHHALLRMRAVMWGPDGKNDWMARADGCFDFSRGDTPAVAVCRALVLSVFGNTVKLPVAAMDTRASSYKNDSVPATCEDLFA